jgi:hypothetical protein
MQTEKKAGNLFQELLERVKARAIERGTWNLEPEEKTPETPKKKKRAKKKPDPRRHENFPKIYPDIFKGPGLWIVFNHLWRHSKKTKSGKLRWCGYIRDVAFDLDRSYSQTRRDFKYLEEKKVVFRWNTGKRFPENIKAGTEPKFHQTILTLCWNPADYKRQRIIEKKALKAKARKAAPCMSS